MMRVYLAGSMTGHPKFNFPLFWEVEHWLKACYRWEVFNPANHDTESTPALVLEAGYATGDVSKSRLFDSRAAFCWDFARILESHAIVLLPGWETSAGAKKERLVAEATGKLVLLAKRGTLEEKWMVEADPMQVRMGALILEPVDLGPAASYRRETLP